MNGNKMSQKNVNNLENKKHNVQPDWSFIKTPPAGNIFHNTSKKILRKKLNEMLHNEEVK